MGSDWLGRVVMHWDRRPIPVLALSGALMALIALVDWWVRPNLSLGFVYIFPVVLSAPFLSRAEVLGLSALCTLLREALGPFAGQPGAVARSALVWLAFLGAGLLFSEMARNQRLLVRSLRLQQEAEQQMRVLADTSPLAILTLDAEGRVLVANDSAHRLLGFETGGLQGADIRPFLPLLATALSGKEGRRALRTAAECRGRRRDGEIFLANVWFSTYETASERRLAAVAWDASENLRDREAAGLDALMAASRIVVRAVSHEVRNVAAAAAAAYDNLNAPREVAASAEFRTLGALLRGLERIAASGLRPSEDRAGNTDLQVVLDEVRIVMEPSFAEADIAMNWGIPEGSLLVQADHQSLLQVFLNLARNSLRALATAPSKRFLLEVSLEDGLVLVRVENSGPAVERPERLFQAFQRGAEDTGLGLYVSRALMRSFKGDLRYEPREIGSCFVVELQRAEG